MQILNGGRRNVNPPKYLYLMLRSKTFTIKFGISNDVNRRLKELQNEYRDKNIIVLAYHLSERGDCSDNILEEKRIKKLLRKHRSYKSMGSPEWFLGSHPEVENFAQEFMEKAKVNGWCREPEQQGT